MRRAMDPQCRKDQMEVWYSDGNWRDELRQQILNANPRWLKRDDESTKEYQDRMLTEMHLLRPRVTEP